MSKLEFRRNESKYGDEVIEAGYWYTRDDGSKFFCSALDIAPKAEQVRTDCGDTYMDYSIDFDDFLAIADKVKEIKGRRKENEDGNTD